MLIVGAKGFAKEVLQTLEQNGQLENLVFYDDVSNEVPQKLFDEFPVLRSIEEAAEYFQKTDKRFSIGIGNPQLRKKLYEKFSQIGGVFTSTISQHTDIGTYDVHIGEGCNILSGVKISNSVKIGKGCLFHYNALITHDVEIGEFSEISPGATLLGRSKVGHHTHVGGAAVILPDIKVGDNVKVAACAVVISDVPSDVTVAGVPAVIKKTHRK